MRSLTVRILIAVLTFTAGVVVSKLFVFSGSESRSFRSLDGWERNWKRGCKPRRSARLVETGPHLTILEPLPDLSLVRPNHEGYSEALEFAETLRAGGIDVQGIHRSKLEGLFRHSKKAAFLRTDKGVVEVVFLPEANGAEKIRVAEHRNGQGYRYSLNTPEESQSLSSGRPFYFIRHQNWFIVSRSEQLAEDVRLALANSR